MRPADEKPIIAEVKAGMPLMAQSFTKDHSDGNGREKGDLHVYVHQRFHPVRWIDVQNHCYGGS